MVNFLQSLAHLETEKLAQAIEDDAGAALPDLRQALAEVNAGQFAAVHAPHPTRDNELLRADIESARLKRSL